jgi:hypothetical protein
MTKAQFANLIAKLPMFQKEPTKNRKVSNDKDSASEQHCTNHNLTSNCDVSQDYHNYSHSIVVQCEPKQTKTSHLTTEVILEIED